MKHYLLTTAFTLLAVCSAYASSIEVRVKTLHRIASENAACLDGCLIKANHVLKTASSPERLGKFIVRSMIKNAISYHESLPSSVPMSWSPRLHRAGIRLEEYHRQLISGDPFNINGFIETIEWIRAYTNETARNFVRHASHVAKDSDMYNYYMVLAKEYDVKTNRLDKLLGNAKTYKNALNSGTGFILTAKKKWFGRLNARGISINRLAGLGLGALAVVAGEFFFAERISAASLDDFDVEVSPEEYDLFYSAVEMERDRLLPYLESSGNLEDQALALEIRSEIEAEGEQD